MKTLLFGLLCMTIFLLGGLLIDRYCFDDKGEYVEGMILGFGKYTCITR